MPAGGFAILVAVSAPAGWHPDPYPAHPGQPARLRYWDGSRWTEHTAGATAPAPRASAKSTTTPDGVPLAGWWRRVGATLIDGLILIPLYAALLIPLYGPVAAEFRRFIADVEASMESGSGRLPVFTPSAEIYLIFVEMSLVCLVFGLLWTFFWLRWKQATPGKLALGMRIRLREAPGRLSWGTIGLRWLAQSGVGLIALVPFVGSLVALYQILDPLWPLWDGRRQALHDKVAKTNVVKVR